MNPEDGLRAIFERADSSLPPSQMRLDETLRKARHARLVQIVSVAAVVVVLLGGAGAAARTFLRDGGRPRPIPPVESPTPTPTPTQSPSPTPTASPSATPTPEPTVSEATCSASEMDPDLPEQPGLPAPVAETRRAIAAAAVACDYSELVRLTEVNKGADEGFSFSFGGGTDPAEYWRQGERRGDEPLAWMVRVLEQPFVTDPDANSAAPGGSYVWPPAHMEPTEENYRQLLDSGYWTEEDIQSYRDFGGYIGYRIGISESGGWLYFIAGD